MALERRRSMILAAVSATVDAITRRKWWRTALTIGSVLFVSASALTLFVVLRLDVWRGLIYELSPFNHQSLMRALLLPYLGVLAVGLAIAVLAQFAFEFVRIARCRR